MERSCSSSSVALLLVFALALGAISSNHAAVPPAAAAPWEDGVVLSIVRLRWKGQDGAVSVAVHIPDISLAGFSNGSHHWHVFPGHEHLFPGAATTLPFGSDSYRDLIGGLANLPGLPLGVAAVKQAARALSAHDPSSTADAAALGAALATLKVTTCEALRVTT